jgi:hypothetical protein
MAKSNKSDLFSPEIMERVNKYLMIDTEKRKTIKKGNNVIHLDYVGVINNDDIKEIEEILNKAGLELSSYDKSHQITAHVSIEDFTFITFLAIPPSIVTELLIGIGSSAIWDTIKLVAFAIWKKLQQKTYNKTSGGKSIKQYISFGLNIEVNNNTKFNIELKGNLSEDIIKESLDKVIDFLKEQQPKEKPEIEDFVYYNSETKQWIKIDVMEELRKIAIERASKHT